VPKSNWHEQQKRNVPTWGVPHVGQKVEPSRGSPPAAGSASGEANQLGLVGAERRRSARRAASRSGDPPRCDRRFAILEREPLADGVRLVRGGLAEHPAEVHDLGLGGRPLTRGDAAPLVGELGRRELRVGRHGRRCALRRTGPRAAIRPGGGHMPEASEGTRADRRVSWPRCRVMRTGQHRQVCRRIFRIIRTPRAGTTGFRSAKPTRRSRQTAPSTADRSPRVVAPHADGITGGRIWRSTPASCHPSHVVFASSGNRRPTVI